MSWNTSAILIHSPIGDDPRACLGTLGCGAVESRGKASFEEASSLSSDGYAVGVVDGWTAIFDAFAFRSFDVPEDEGEGLWPAPLEARLRDISRESQVVSFLLAGASGTAGLARFRDGQMTRCFLFQQGEQLKDVGEADTDEPQALASGDHEDAVMSLVARIAVGWDAMWNAEFALFERG